MRIAPTDVQAPKKRLGIIFILKAGNVVVGVSNEDDFPSCIPASPPVCPEVEAVMEVDV